MLAKYHLCQLGIESDEADKMTSICQLPKEDWKDGIITLHSDKCHHISNGILEYFKPNF